MQHTIPLQQARPRRLRAVQLARRLVQLGILVFVGSLVVAHATGASGSASAEAFCPFGGIETIYQYLASGGRTLPHTHLSNLVLSGAVVLLAVVARGAFCGWICPFGALQEWLFNASAWVQRRIPPLGRAVRALREWAAPRRRSGQPARVTGVQRLDRWLRWGRYVVLALVLAGTIGYTSLVFRSYDPWAALLTITELELGAGAVVLGAVALAGLVVERPWCRYACPLGAIVGLAGMLSPLRIQREGARCAGCTLCHKRCPMGLPVDTSAQVTDPSCIMCLECLEDCPKPGALELRLVLPRARQPEAGTAGAPHGPRPAHQFADYREVR